MTSIEYTHHKLQTIYEDALAPPFDGYARSSRFKRALFDCPRCKGLVYVRLRFRTGSPIGAVCSECRWMTTYRQKRALPLAPVQHKLF